MSEKALLTVSEVMVKLRISRSTVLNMCRDGTFRCFKVGRQFRIYADSLPNGASDSSASDDG